MAFNTTINTSLLTTYLVRKFIPSLEAELQFQKFTTKAMIPEGQGNIARFNVFSEPTGSTTAISPEGSGTANEITTMTTTGTDATIAEYGEFIKVTRLEDYASIPASRSELSDRMSYGAAKSIDALVRGQADGTTTQRRAIVDQAGVDSTSQPVAFSAAAVIGAARVLRDNKARGFMGVSGHPQRHFAAIMSPKAELDMVTEASTGRMTWAEANTDVPGMAGQGKWVNGFMGSVYGTACYRSQNLTNATITVNSWENFLLAEGGIGASALIDMDPQIYVNTASAGDIGNPYRNANTIAWHIYFATALIDSARVVKIYSVA